MGGVEPFGVVERIRKKDASGIIEIRIPQLDAIGAERVLVATNCARSQADRTASASPSRARASAHNSWTQASRPDCARSDEGRRVGQRGRILGAATEIRNSGHALPGVAERARHTAVEPAAARRIEPPDRQPTVPATVSIGSGPRRTGHLRWSDEWFHGCGGRLRSYGRLMSIRLSTPVRRSGGNLVPAAGSGRSAWSVLSGLASVRPRWYPCWPCRRWWDPDQFSYPFSAGWHIAAEMFFALQHLTLLARIVGLAAYCGRYGSRLVRAGLVVTGLG